MHVIKKLPALADDGHIDGVNESLMYFLMGSIPHGVVVRHPDYAAQSAPLSQIPAEVNVSLIPGGAFEGRVVHAEGETSRPASRVEVVAQMVSPQQQSQDPFAPGSAEVRTLTDADGKYRFDSLPEGTYRVGVEPIDTWVNDWVETAVVAPRRTSKAPEILLTHGGVVRVQLIDVETGKPPALPPGARGYIFTTAPVDNDPATADPETGGTGLELPFRTPVTAFTEAGVAERHLPAGRYVISAMIRGSEHDWAWEGLGKSPIGNPVHKIVPGKTIEVAVRVRKQAAERSRSGTWVRVPPRTESTGDSGGSKKTGEPKETKNEKPSSNSSGGLEVKDWGQRLRYASPKSSDGWWLVRSAAADADAGRATLGAEVADVGFAAPLDYGDNLKVTLHFAPEDDGPESKATPRSAPVRDAR